MKKQKIIISHRFLDRYTVLGAILLAVYGIIAIEVVFGIIIRVVTSRTDLLPAGSVFGALIVLAIHKRWFYPEFEGNLRGGRPGLGFRLGLFILIAWALVPVNMIRHPENYAVPTLATLSIALMAGFAEETAFRGLSLSYLMRQWKDRNLFRQAALVSGIVFGLIHAANIFAGADPLQTLFQVIGSVSVGFIFAAVYLRTGSILPCMFYHALHDIIAIACESNVSENGIMSARAFWWGDVFNLAMAAVMAAAAFWLLRDAKTEQIREIWNRKWKLAAVPAEAAAPETGK